MDEELKQALEELRDAAIDESLEDTEVPIKAEEPVKSWSQIKDDRYRPELVKKVEVIQKNKRSEDSRLRNMSSEDRRHYQFTLARQTGSSEDWSQVIKQLI